MSHDEEKAEALDRAIEFEDAVGSDRRRAYERSIIMHDKDKLFRLHEAVGRLLKDQEELEAIYREIGGPAATESRPETQTTAAGPQRRARGGRPSRQGADGGGTKQYWRKVACSVCHRGNLGSRVYQEQRYPVLHQDPGTKSTCKGSFVAVAEETKGGD